MQLAVGICCLQIFCSVVNMVLMGLVLRPSLMVIYNSGVLLYAKVSPFYNVFVVYTQSKLCTNF